MSEEIDLWLLNRELKMICERVETIKKQEKGFLFFLVLAKF